MAPLARIALVLLLTTVQLPEAFALDNAPATISQELVPFSSDEGLARLAHSAAKVDFPALANQFEAQSNRAFCGPALPRLCSTPFEIAALIFRATGADYIQKTLNTFRAPTILRSLASHRTT